jgi:hypothetical protein
MVAYYVGVGKKLKLTVILLIKLSLLITGRYWKYLRGAKYDRVSINWILVRI